MRKFENWINSPISVEEAEGKILIEAGERTDFFIDPLSGRRIENAPFYAFAVGSDFTFSCEVTPAFTATYDAGALMLYFDPDSWVKLAFEMTDMGYPAVVSVATKGSSDDCNGERIDGASLRLKMSRKGDTVGLYYSVDGSAWKMMRLLRLTATHEGAQARCGVLTQSPSGKGCSAGFSGFRFSENAVADMRKGE